MALSALEPPILTATSTLETNASVLPQSTKQWILSGIEHFTSKWPTFTSAWRCPSTMRIKTKMTFLVDYVCPSRIWSMTRKWSTDSRRSDWIVLRKERWLLLARDITIRSGTLPWFHDSKRNFSRSKIVDLTLENLSKIGVIQFIEAHFWITNNIAVFGLPANQNPDP